MRKIFAASLHTGGANAISPVIRQLYSRDYDVKVIGYETSGVVFHKNKIQYSEPSMDLFTEKKDVSVPMIRSILTDYRPDLVLTGRSIQDKDHPEVIDQTTILAARQLGIPTVAVSDFWTGNSEYFSDIYSENGKFAFLPDYIAVLDDIQKKIMIDEGFSEKMLRITGNPFFDDLNKTRSEFTREDSIRIRNEFNFGIEDKVILYASQPVEFYYGKDESNPKYLGYTEKTVLTDIIDSLKEISITKKIPLGKIQLLIKAHPRENPDDLERVMKECRAEESGIRYRIDQEYNTRMAVLSSDLTLTTFSTVAFESSAMGVPALSIQPGLKDKANDFLTTNKIGVTIPIYSKTDIAKKIYSTLYGNFDPRKQIPQTLSDGKSTYRVINLIEDILNRRVEK